jgi:hypothetical protein
VSRTAWTIYSHIINLFSMLTIPSGSKKKKARAHTPASPSSAQAARAECASKRASTKRDDSAGATMSSARVDDDMQIVEEGSNGGSQQHIEPEIIINPGGCGSGSGSEPGNDVNAGLVPDRSGSESGQHHSSEQNQSGPPDGGNAGQMHGDSSEPSHQSQNVGSGACNSEMPPRMPASGGAGDDRPGVASSAHRRTEARERAVMVTLGLVEEAHDIMQLSGSIRLAGQSKLEAKRLLDKVKTCIIELMGLRVPEDDKVFPRLKKARKDMQRLIMQSDEFEANMSASAREEASRPNPSPFGCPQQMASPEMPREPSTGLRYTLAMRQLDCEIARLNSPRLIDVNQGADVKPDILKDLL